MLVTDANGDGLNDIIIGSDHGYGLGWYEQKMEGGKRSFVSHWIETDYPTFHTMALADLDGDGKPELITGKQLLAHNGGDVGGFEPVFVFYYKFDKGRFERHIISYSYLTPYFGPDSKEAPPQLRGRSRHAVAGGGHGWRRKTGRSGSLQDRPLRLPKQRLFAKDARNQLAPHTRDLSLARPVGDKTAGKKETVSDLVQKWVSLMCTI